MPRHKLTHTLTIDAAAPVQVGYTLDEDTAPSMVTTIAANSTNQAHAFAVLTDAIVDLFMYSDQNLTIKTNSVNSPSQTITLTASRPLIWNSEDGYFTNPITNDVVTLYVTNNTTATATLRVYVLSDSTIVSTTPYMADRDYTIHYRIDGLPEAAAQLQAANGAFTQHATQTGGSLTNLNNGFLAYAAAAGVARQAVAAIGEALKEARDIAADLAKENLKIRDSLRELANIKGDKGPTDAVIASRMKFMLQSGMGGSEATKFMEGFEGAIYSAKQKGFVTDKVAEQFETVSAQTAMRTGLPGEAAGKFAALLATQGPMGSAEAGAGRMETVVQLLNKAPAKLSGLFPALTNVVGDIVQEGGNVENIEEAAAILSVANEKRMHPSMAGNMMRHAMRGVMKLRTSPLQKMTQFGLTGKEDFTTIFETMAPAIRKGGQDWLFEEMGINNMKDREAFLAFASAATTPDVEGGKSLLRQRIEEARAEGGGAAALAKNREFLDTTMTGRNAMAQRKLEAANFLQGQQGEGALTYKAQAEAALRSRGELDTFGWSALDAVGDLGGIATQFGMRSSREDRILTEARKIAMGDAWGKGKAGPRGLGPMGPGLGFDPVHNLFRAGVQAVETMSGKTQEQDLTDTLNRVIGNTEGNTTLKEIRDLLAGNLNPGMPAPPPATDTFSPKGSGGASGGW